MSWTDPIFGRIVDLLGARTGLTFAEPRHQGAEIGIRRALARSRIKSLDAYGDELSRDAGLLDDLVAELTIPETYFFREPEQFAFLRRVALPSLRACRGAAHSPRAWSAGCATGEEAYSLAMMLSEEGFPDTVPVLATDISRAALAKARAARYGAWSLRGEGAEAARRHLDPEGDRFVVAEPIRRRVAFEHLNLALDIYPSYASGTWGSDLILCRNVLIYFDPDTVRAVARRLHDALAEGGWLIVASTDPPLAEFAPFEIVATGQGIFYRRRVAAEPETVPLIPPPHLAGATGSVPRPRAERRPIGDAGSEYRTRGTPKDRVGALRDEPETLADALKAARADLARGDYDRAAARTREFDHDADAAALHVRALANLDPIEAERAAAQAAARHPVSAELQHLRAVLLAGLDRDDEAARAARKVLYLDRSLAIAHFLLGTILRRRGDRSGAWRAFRNARDLSASRPADEVVPLSDGEPAGRLAESARRQMADLNADGSLALGSEDRP